jgi:purine nucleosidase
MMPMSHAVLIDTDIGDDVDDAFALVVAARHPRLRLVGVTTVDGPVADRARLAHLVLAACSRPDVPIGAGASERSDGRRGAGRMSHAPLLGDLPAFAGPSALSLIHSCAREHERLTVIALGPLTNVAAAIAAEPRIARHVRLVVMGGSPSYPYPDWNIRCDPAAARAVLRSGMDITMIGMNVTMRCDMTRDQLRRLFEHPSPYARVLTRCVLAWRTPLRRMPILHDALAVAAAAEPGLVSTAMRRVVVFRGGFTIAIDSMPPNARVCIGLDQRRFAATLETLILSFTGSGERGRGGKPPTSPLPAL